MVGNRQEETRGNEEIMKRHRGIRQRGNEAVRQQAKPVFCISLSHYHIIKLSHYHIDLWIHENEKPLLACTHEKTGNIGVFPVEKIELTGNN
jgi:hypothetical protein